MRVGIDWSFCGGDLCSSVLHTAYCCSSQLPTLDLCGISITYFVQSRLVHTDVDHETLKRYHTILLSYVGGNKDSVDQCTKSWRLLVLHHGRHDVHNVGKLPTEMVIAPGEGLLKGKLYLDGSRRSREQKGGDRYGRESSVKQGDHFIYLSSQILFSCEIRRSILPIS